MPDLLVLRHAKSDWGSGAEDDHERPLAQRGVKAAKSVGRFIAASGQVPDLVLTSTAVRARTTVEVAAAAGKWKSPVEEVRQLYGAAAHDVVALLASRDLPEAVMVVGHEPTWSELVSLLTGGGRVRMPTAALACLEVDGTWRELAPGRGRLLWLVVPKLIAGVV